MWERGTAYICARVERECTLSPCPRPKISSTPNTDAQRKRLHPKKVKPPKLFKPTVRAVKEIVPNKLIPKLKPMTPLTARSLDRHA